MQIAGLPILPRTPTNRARVRKEFLVSGRGGTLKRRRQIPSEPTRVRFPVSSIEEVRRAEERLRQGDASLDADTSGIFDELIADDVLFVQGAGNSVGKSGVLSGHRPPRKRNFSSVVNREIELRDLGSVVAVSCRTDYSIENRRFSLRALRIWKKVEGSWKVSVVALLEVPVG